MFVVLHAPRHRPTCALRILSQGSPRHVQDIPETLQRDSRHAQGTGKHPEAPPRHFKGGPKETQGHPKANMCTASSARGAPGHCWLIKLEVVPLLWVSLWPCSRVLVAHQFCFSFFVVAISWRLLCLVWRSLRMCFSLWRCFVVFSYGCFGFLWFCFLVWICLRLRFVFDFILWM